jgi:transposase-like protein/DNA-directed RNA polymerase subunit RPC12/RpoP
VSVRRERWSCECAFFTTTGLRCIHILAVQLRAGFSAQSRSGSGTLDCERCRSRRVVRDGRRPARGGFLQRYRCQSCGARFTGREGFQRRRTAVEQIAIALDLHFRGLSIRRVADHLAQVYGTSVAPSTVYDWIASYSRRAVAWMDRLSAQTGERWHVDETVISVNGRPRYLWNVIDADTRFLLATEVSRVRGVREVRRLMARAKEATPDRPMEVRSDGMPWYRTGIGRELAYRSGAQVVNPHHRVRSIRAKVSNNLVERLHGTVKDRIKVLRGFDSGPTARTWIEGFRVDYNMVRPHQQLGTTPAKAAGLGDHAGFRWKEILLQAARRVPRGEVELVFVVE